MAIDLSKTRHVVVSDPLSAEVMAQPTRSLEYRLTLLEESLRQSAATSGTRIVIPNVPLDAEVADRDVVFYNPASGRYERALAGAVYASGVFQNTGTSLAAGVVVRRAGGLGDVMVGGFDLLSDDDKQAGSGMLEAGLTFRAGPYYVSATEAGKLTYVPPAYKVQLLLASDAHFVVAPAYSSLESFEDNFPVPVGMRPVGSLRSLAPQHRHVEIVGFDGLELHDTENQRWRSTADGAANSDANADHAANGWLIADAQISSVPTSPFFVQVRVSTGGVVTVQQAPTLVALAAGDFHATDSPSQVLSESTWDSQALWEITLKDPQSLAAVGTFYFRFTSWDLLLARAAVLKVPDSFQGWKQINTPEAPAATVVVAGGKVTRFDITSPSLGFLVPPTVTVSASSGVRARARALLDDVGSIREIELLPDDDDFPNVKGGTGYTTATVSFDSRVTAVKLLNGGTGAEFAITVTDGAIAEIEISDGGENYHMAPGLEVADIQGVGKGAVLRPVVQDGTLIRVEIVAGGEGYTQDNVIIRTMPTCYGYPEADDIVPTVIGGVPVTDAEIELTTTTLRLTGVKILCPGLAFDEDTEFSVTGGGGSGAEIVPVYGPAGELLDFVVTNQGVDYTSAPVIEWDESVDGHGLVVEAIVEAFLNQPTISNAGAAFRDQPQVVLGLPLRGTSIDIAGTGYSAATYVGSGGGVIISAPDIAGGTQAVATAYRGGLVEETEVTNAGADYSQPENTSAVFVIDTITEASLDYAGRPLVQLNPLFLGWTLQSVAVVRGGYGLSAGSEHYGVAVTTTHGSEAINLVAHGLKAGQRVKFQGSGLAGGLTVDVWYAVRTVLNADSFTLTDAAGGSIVALSSNSTDMTITADGTYMGGLTGGVGSGGTFAITVAKADGLVHLRTTTVGAGYIQAPTVLLPTTAGERARGHAVLHGTGAVFEINISGLGGRWSGDSLQAKTWSDDFEGSESFKKPLNCGFYYNLKADPALRNRWPARPLEKCVVNVNGVELRTAVVSELSGQLLTDADIGLTRKTLAWRGCARLGAPWDAVWRHLQLDPESNADAAYLPPGAEDHGWRWWEDQPTTEPNQSHAVVHVNRSSRYFHSGRVQSLAVQAPLKLVDTLTGLDSAAQNTPMSGQLLLTLDTEENLLSPFAQQIDLAKDGARISIFHNTTGRPVFLRSIQLKVVFQTNSDSTTLTAADAALITVGTSAGNYRNIVGVANPSLTSTPGKSTCLHAVNQVKELFPDVDQASPTINPGEQVYLQVDRRAGNTIATQLVKARVLGHVL